jgi:hypothetical protein
VQRLQRHPRLAAAEQELEDAVRRELRLGAEAAPLAVELAAERDLGGVERPRVHLLLGRA